MGRLLGLVTIASAALLSGCFRHRAVIERDARRGEVEVRFDSAEAFRAESVRVSFVVERVPPGVALAGANLKSDAELPCTGGIAATGWERSAPTGRDGSLTPGERVVIHFPGEALVGASVPNVWLDLLVVTGSGARRCVPLAISGVNGLRWETEQRWTLGLDATIEAFPSHLGPVSQAVAFPLNAGVWLGRHHVQLGVGIVAAGCPERYCAPQTSAEDEEKINDATGYLFSLGLRRPLYEYGEVSFGLDVRYRALHLAADTYDGRETQRAHGPVIAPYVGAVPPLLRPTDLGGSRLALIGFEVPVGYVFAGDGERSLSVGLGLVFHYSAF